MNGIAPGGRMRRMILAALLCGGAAACLFAAGEAARGAVYVVDAANPAADDKNPGTEEKPFRTIQRGADAARAGDTVCVMEGNYPQRVALGNSGEEGRPIVLQAVPLRSVALRGFEANGVSHIRLTGFVLFAPGKADGIRLAGGAHHIELTDNRIENAFIGIRGGGKQVRYAYNKHYKVQCGMDVTAADEWVLEDNDFERAFKHAGGDCDYSVLWGQGLMIRRNHYHGTRREEVPGAHLDCMQSYILEKNKHMRLCQVTFEDNVLNTFSQGTMIRNTVAGVDPYHHWIVRRNIIWGPGEGWDSSPTALSLTPVSDLEVRHNTIARISGYGIRNTEGHRAQVRDNIFFDVNVPYTRGKDATAQGNLQFGCARPDANMDVADPEFADPNAGNFRLTKGSPAIDAGTDKTAIGALEYPNVYHVDPRHQGASDEGFGYAGWPYKTAVRALAVAEAGETILLRGGVYRETLRPPRDGVTIRAMKGEKAVVSGADLIEGWKRRDTAWAAPLASEPKKVLRDGQPWTEFAYDAAAKTITVKTGGDPRLHVFETVVRRNGIDLAGRKDVKVEGIEVVDTLAEPTVGMSRQP